MKYVGAHVSISGGVENAPVNAYAHNYLMYSDWYK